jgi:hypothetical protein
MSMVCTRCDAVHEQALHCPTCGAALVYHAPRKQGFNYAELARGWQHTDGGRFFIGIGLAQGLFYGLNLLVKSIFVAAYGEPVSSQSLPALTEVICVQSLQLFGLLVGSIIAGVARRQAIVLGVYIGVANAILSYLLAQWPIQAIGTPLYYAQPFLRIFAGPVSWFRLGLGVAVGVAGCQVARYALDAILNLSDQFSMNEYMQESVIVWELRGVALLLGGIVAGAGTANGLKQGLMAGMFTGAVMNVVMVYRNAKPEIVVLSLVLSFALSLVGGWFGGQLLPRVVSRKRLDGIGP